ncbi:MAG: hypothetical protein DMF69_22350 [Acidobacteria bacterium]|nr:MAG: hypothetical protein DMF69_22350 [Acidobacteriota bacterium]
MKRSSPIALFVVAVFLSSIIARGQSNPTDNQTRPRSVNSIAQQTSQSTSKTPEKAATPEVATQAPNTEEVARSVEGEKKPSLPATLHLTPSGIQTRISEAQRLLRSRPMATALTTTPSIDFVTVAALDRNTSRTHLVTLSKQTFLKKGSQITLTSSLGTLLTIRVVRANGVNTALTIFNAEGQALVPLTIEYPIERNGLFREMAYYTSAHPALLSQDLVRSGQAYVRNMLDLAVKRLKERGVTISPEIVNVAERLCVVEHIDHQRFLGENRLALYDEIFSLYALNQLDTYRYSVSTAGAGGMIQMIPWAYNLQRQRYPGVGMIPDFVTAMRNHGNALQAMLLYMQDTWNELAANEDVKSALNTKIATPSELLAAGYNSNAAKLPGYIRRGGEDWKILIPRETQMYLQIYKSIETLVPMKMRPSVQPTVQTTVQKAEN